MIYLGIMNIHAIRIMVQIMQRWDAQKGEFTPRVYLLSFLSCKTHLPLLSLHITQMETSLVE